MTRHFGTPFKNSLTPEQLKIKSDAVFKRKKTFVSGIIVGSVFLLIFKPFLSE
jgi:hypothetical protein